MNDCFRIFPRNVKPRAEADKFTVVCIFLQRLLNLYGFMKVRTISASFDRSRSGKNREIRPTYSDFFANVFQWKSLYAAFFTLRCKQTFKIDYLTTWLLIHWSPLYVWLLIFSWHDIGNFVNKRSMKFINMMQAHTQRMLMQP